VTSNAVLPDLLPPLLKPDTVLLTLQNGLGNEEFLSAHFGGDRVMGGLCFVCLNRTAPGVIQHIAQGRIDLGEYKRPPGARLEQIAVMFANSGVECHVEPSLAAARWKKLVWNIPFNGLSIAGGCVDTATILGDPMLERRVRELMTEVIDTAAGLGHDLPAGLMEDMIQRTQTMTRYKPSSLIDFEEGRDVELEAIWGEPVRQAAAARLRMPRVERLYQEVKKCIEQRQAVRS
jgi:2-dehydropantoate 2-reductase